MTNSGCATSRAAAERRRRRSAAALALGLALAAGAGWAQAPAAPTGFELTRSVQQSLSRIQELWLQWVGATLQDNVGRADETLRSLMVAAREVGFRHLPDLALAAAAQARQSARSGELDRARRQLAAAEQLDPGRPDVAFASAAVARADGEWLDWVGESLRGIGRAWRGREHLHLLVGLGLWLLTVLVVASAGYVLVLGAVHGGSMLLALRQALPEGGGGWLAPPLLLIVLVAPFALPGGIFVGLLVWSALLWSFARRGERVLIALGWLIAVAAPFLAAHWQRELALEESPPLRAVAAFGEGRLYGAIFADVQVLRSALPGEPAVNELAADLHRTLGQWDLARSLYRRALVEEPDNVAVLLNLGAYHFRKGEFALANGYFERATRARPSAAAWYDLSLGLSEAYDFDESRQALMRARELDGASVDRWMSTPIPDKVLTFNGSLSRTPELRRGLLTAWARKGSAGAMARPLVRALPALLVLAALVVALGFDALRRRRLVPRGAAVRLPKGAIARWSATLLPALPAAEEGRALPAWGNVLLLATLVLLPLITSLAGELPVFGWPGPRDFAWLTAAGGFAYLGWRLYAGLSEARE